MQATSDDRHHDSAPAPSRTTQKMKGRSAQLYCV